MSPRRGSAAGRAYLDLQALARRAGRPAQEYLVMYVHECFLHRLARSHHRDRMILKGGMLLAAMDTRRPTADIDLLATALRNDVASVAAAVREVLAIETGDGVVFSPDRLTARIIRDAELYAGVRLAVPAMVDRTGGHATCNNVPSNEYVKASADCYFWPGVVGATTYLTKGQSVAATSYIACSTHITQGYINVEVNGTWHKAS